jgi:2-hydroxychromene-2-carboxylate isomerase
MSLEVEYYFTPQSPWAYLGHARFLAIAKAAMARVRVLPVDLGGKVFPVSGGLPLAQRSKQRQAYRLLEMTRFAEHLQMPMVMHPRFFPVASDDASRLIIAVDRDDGSEAALSLAGRLMRSVWVDQGDIADPVELAQALAAEQLAADRLDASRRPETQAQYESHSRRAVEAGVFGAPSFVIDGELFWGQDRLDFVARRLARG